MPRNKRVLRTLINEQGPWEDEMLPALRTITILVHLGGFGLCKAEGQPGIWWWSLGDWEFFFSPVWTRHGKVAQKVAFSLASKPPDAFSPPLVRG